MAREERRNTEDDAALAPADQLQNHAGYLLRRGFQVGRRKMLKRAEPLGLSPMQTAAIVAMLQYGAASQNQLGRYIGVEPGNMQGVIADLKKKNLIQSRRDTVDKRHYILELTDDGRAMADDVVAARSAGNEDILSIFTARERERFLELMRKFLADPEI